MLLLVLELLQVELVSCVLLTVELVLLLKVLLLELQVVLLLVTVLLRVELLLLELLLLVVTPHRELFRHLLGYGKGSKALPNVSQKLESETKHAPRCHQAFKIDL